MMDPSAKDHADPQLIYRKVYEDFRALVSSIERAIVLFGSDEGAASDVERLRKAKKAAEAGAELARSQLRDLE